MVHERNVLFTLMYEILVARGYEITKVAEPASDFGPFSGFQFDSSDKGGLFYAWENGNIQIHLVNYQSGAEIIKDQLFLMDDVSDHISEIAIFFRNVIS